MNESALPERCQLIVADLSALMREAHVLKARLAEDAERAHKEQTRLLLAMLDVLDSFERVFANIEPREATADRQARIWVGNFRTVRRVLDNHLRDLGVVRIEAPEGKVVPGLHTVTETREQLDLDDEVILEEVQRGYLWRNRVLRKSTVIAVKN